MSRRSPRGRSARACLAATAIAAAALGAGCSTNVLAPDPRGTVATATVPVALLGGRDGRARFREAFCAAAGRERGAALSVPECDALLVRLPDEPSAPPAQGHGGSGPDAPAPPPSPLRVLFVPGLASDCAGQAALLDAELRPAVERLGHSFGALPVSGFASSAANARRLSESLLAASEPGSRVLLLTHSKGSIDALRMLVEHPAARDRVAALVSIAGAIGGSPLARLSSGDALALAAWVPGLGCDPGDRGGLRSLVPERRQRWLAGNPLPGGVRYYSLVALPEPARISPGLRAGHRLLSRIDPRNDGNLLFTDQVIPGATLLGYLNADHWSVATDLGASPAWVVRAASGAAGFPRKAMIEAVIGIVSQDLR